MYQKNDILYAGISNVKGLKLIEDGIVTTTGYSVQKVTNGEKLGTIYEMGYNELKGMFTETDDGLNSNKFVKNNIIIAGVENEIGFDLCIKQENLYTGKKFVRIHDGFEMGNVIYLGIDYSYDRKGRVDLPKYYVEVDDIVENQDKLDETE